MLLFGSLLERRHGALAPLVLFALGGVGRRRRCGRARDDPARGRRERRGARADRRLGDAPGCATCDAGMDAEGDVIGAGVFAAVLLLMPLAVEEASPTAGATGVFAGLLAAHCWPAAR